MRNRFIKYIISRASSWQTAIFDTLTKRSIYASDFMFSAADLKHW